MSTEVSFPRGGVEYVPKKIVFDEDGLPDILATKNSNKNAPKKKLPLKDKNKKSKKSQQKEKGETKAEKTPVDDIGDEEPERLITSKVKKGFLMLAAVRQAMDYEIKLNLPNNVVGVASITNMPDSYTNLLKRYAQSSDDLSAEELCPLGDMFSPGQVIPCICLEDTTDDLRVVQVSINPRDVNEHMRVQSLTRDMVIYGAVASIEDHGCAIDLGLPNITAFMRSDNNSGLRTGMIKQFQITKLDVRKLIGGESRTLEVQQYPGELDELAIAGNLDFSLLTPGQLVTATVRLTRKTGLIVEMGRLKIKGYIHATHLPEKRETYKPLAQVKARVLAVNPSSKYVYLTMLPSLLQYDGQLLNHLELSPGELVEVSVKRIVDRCAFLQLPDGSETYISVVLLPEQYRKKNASLPTDKINCYWRSWNHLEHRAVLETKQLDYQSQLSMMKCGATYTAVITELNSTGAKVKLQNGVKGLIDIIHLSEVPLRHPEKKFKIGDILTCRVLTMGRHQAWLTAKPSLVSHDQPALCSHDEVREGDTVRGVIVKLTSGAIIAFYNRLTGFVPEHHLMKGAVPNPTDQFYVGQSVKCRVLQVDKAKKRLLLTFILDGDLTEVSSRKRQIEPQPMEEAQPAKRRREVTEEELSQATAAAPYPNLQAKNVRLGQVLTRCSMLKKDEVGIVVKSGTIKAYLPRMELSDYPLLSRMMFDNDEGSFPELICVRDGEHSAGGGTILSNKMLYKHYAEKTFPLDDLSLKIGSVYPATVLVVVEGGVFVSLPGGRIGKADSDSLPVEHGGFGELPSLFPGRSVLANILSTEDKRIVWVSLREIDCPLTSPDDERLVFRMFSHYQRELQRLRKLAGAEANNRRVSGYSVGDLVSGIVVGRTSKHVELRLDDGVICMANHYLSSDFTGTLGSEASGIVVFVDVVNGELEVLMDPTHVKSIKSHSTETKYTMVREGQVIKAEIVYSRPEYSLAMLKAHALGKMVMLPTHLHPNSVHAAPDMIYGQLNRIIIKFREPGGLPLGVIQTTKEYRQTRAEKLRVEANMPDVGSKVQVVVTSLTDSQLLVRQTNSRAGGRIYMNEVRDDPKPGQNPLKDFLPRQILEAVITGFTIVKQHYKARSLKEDPNRVLMNLTLRCKRDEGVTPAVGDEKLVFVEKLSLREKPPRLDVIATDGTRGQMIWYDVGRDAVSLKQLADQYPVGLCVRARVKSIAHGGLISYTAIAQPDDHEERIPAVIKAFDAGRGLIVSCSVGKKCLVPLSEITEPGQDVDIASLKRGSIVQCQLVPSRYGQFTLSLRRKVGLETRAALQAGETVPAVVSQITATFANVMACGHIMTLDFLSESGLKEFSQRYVRGSACWVTITRTKGKLGAEWCRDETAIQKALDSLSAEAEDNMTAASQDDDSEKDNDNNEDDDQIDPAWQARLRKRLPASKQTVNDCSAAEKSRKRSSKMAPVGPIPGNDDAIVEEKPSLEKRGEMAAAAQLAGMKMETDTTTGVTIVFAEKAAKKSQMGLDYGTSLNSLSQSLDQGGTNAKIKKLEQSARSIKKKPAKTETEGESTNSITSALQKLAQQGSGALEDECLAATKKSPNSGATWVQLIQATAEMRGVESARLRAEQALETISYRLEAEKLLVWAEFLRLELHYGTADGFDNVMRRSLQNMDEKKMYNEIVKLYVSRDRIEDAEQCYLTLLRKRPEDLTCWTDTAQLYYSNGRLDSARTLLQKCLKAITNKQHVAIICKFSQLEFRYGTTERGKELMESILSNFPKRIDVWSVYVDALIKAELITDARAVLRRAVMQKLNPKKLAFFLKKLETFEREHGTEATVAEVLELTKTLTSGKPEEH